MTNISVIIPNYNGEKYLKDCLNHLSIAFNNSPDSEFEIIMVDNGSTDNSAEIFNYLSKLKIINYKFKIILLKKNLGFASAVNQGIKASKYPYVCLLNNDLNLDKNWFRYITRAISTNTNVKIATFCGTILNKDGTKHESQGLKFYYRGKCDNINNGHPFLKTDICQLKSVLVWGSSAAAVVYKKNVIDKVGLFDESFFAYEEDVDLALRLHKLGYLTIYIPMAISYHLGGGTSKLMGNLRHIHDAKNWIYIIIKNYSLNEFTHYIFPIIEERLRNLSGLIKNTISIYKLRSFYFLPLSLAKAYFPVIANFPAMFKKRRQFQNLLKSTK